MKAQFTALFLFLTTIIQYESFCLDWLVGGVNVFSTPGVSYDAVNNKTFVQHRGGGLIPVFACQFNF